MSNNTTAYNSTIVYLATACNLIVANKNCTQSYGEIVHKSLNPRYVMLSFVISYIGSWTTLELINRRTASQGLYNCFLLGGAAISMGGIGIWCMHFIGNRAIILGSGSLAPQISYSAALTTLSFFFPVIVLFLALAALGANEDISLVRLMLGGTIVGLGVVGMHYIGQASVRNYECIYYVVHVIGAAIIAVTAPIVAFGVFFLFRAAWNAKWWIRGICALILAGAVSGTHWVASTGTQYYWVDVTGFTPNDSMNATTFSVIILSIGACFVLLIIALLAQVQKQRLANRAQQIALAAVVFDQSGKILVDADGLLPLKKITDKYREKNFNDVFGISHPAFLWMYRASRNWAGIASLIPVMRDHLHRSNLRNRLGLEPDGDPVNEERASIADYSIIFRELFCAAAAELADDMHQPVEKLGKMFDEIISTGERPSRRRKDLEKGKQDALGKGQILFLVRSADKADARQLQAAGYRFAPLVPNILPLISRILQITPENLKRQLAIMYEFAVDPHTLDDGCHLAVFAARASMIHGFDILVRQDARNLLPTMQLPFKMLDSWQLDYLRTMDSKTVVEIRKLLSNASKAVTTLPKEKTFAVQVLSTLEALTDEIGDPFFNDAILIAKPVQVPCRGLTENSPPGSATVIVFSSLIPIQNRAPGRKLDFTPLALFKTQQHVYKNSPDQAVFARRAYREFAPVLNMLDLANISETGEQQDETESKGRDLRDPISTAPFLGRASQGKFRCFGHRIPPQGGRVRKESSSENNLLNVPSEDKADNGTDFANRPSSPVNKADNDLGGLEMTQLSEEGETRSARASKTEEAPSFVDELFKTIIQTKHAH